MKFQKINEKVKRALAKDREIRNQMTKKEKTRYYSYLGLTISLILICGGITLSLHFFTKLVFPIHILTVIPLLFIILIICFWFRWSFKFESMLESRLDS